LFMTRHSFNCWSQRSNLTWLNLIHLAQTTSIYRINRFSRVKSQHNVPFFSFI
jgi:hypothetical protein